MKSMSISALFSPATSNRPALTSVGRIVLDTPGFLAFCPFASRFPFETWILPRVHHSSFEVMGYEMRRQLADVLKETLTRINGALSSPPYNFIVHAAPSGETDLKYYHWHVEIMLKLTKISGFEWGSGFYINPVPPEEAASYLREVVLERQEVEA